MRKDDPEAALRCLINDALHGLRARDETVRLVNKECELAIREWRPNPPHRRIPRLRNQETTEHRRRVSTRRRSNQHNLSLIHRGSDIHLVLRLGKRPERLIVKKETREPGEEGLDDLGTGLRQRVLIEAEHSVVLDLTDNLAP